MQRANRTMQRANSRLQRANRRLQKANSTMQRANSRLQKANSTMQRANSRLLKANSTMQRANSTTQRANSSPATLGGWTLLLDGGQLFVHLFSCHQNVLDRIQRRLLCINFGGNSLSSRRSRPDISRRGQKKLPDSLSLQLVLQNFKNMCSYHPRSFCTCSKTNNSWTEILIFTKPDTNQVKHKQTKHETKSDVGVCANKRNARLHF